MGFLQPRSNFAVWNAYNLVEKHSEGVHILISIKVGYQVLNRRICNKKVIYQHIPTPCLTLLLVLRKSRVDQISS